MHTSTLDSWSQGALWTTVRMGLDPAQLGPFYCGLSPQGNLASFWAIGHRVSKFCLGVDLPPELSTEGPRALLPRDRH